MNKATLPHIANDETHHRVNGRAAYTDRFLNVGKFHEPGLASVRDVSGAFHITPNGQAAYPTRFDRTFGFYDNLAAVNSGGTWFHVRPDGSQAYCERYAWCGNFQESRCPVRTLDGEYFHINQSGVCVYSERHLYAGDYRDGVACVRLTSGFTAHVDYTGRYIYNARFLDLDVLHKGFARARDAQGWMHVNRLGQPAYEARFAEVEPFYNGYAHVLDFHGQRLVVSEAGVVCHRIPVPKTTSNSGLTGSRPLLVLVGAPGAGKSTLAEWLRTHEGLRFVSIDNERSVHGDGCSAGEMRAWASFLNQIELGSCNGVEFSGSGPFVSHVQQAIKNSKRAYRVVWIETPSEVCIARIQKRHTMIPYPFSGETLVETTRELHFRLKREMSEGRYWKSHLVISINGQLSVEKQGAAVTQLLGDMKP